MKLLCFFAWGVKLILWLHILCGCINSTVIAHAGDGNFHTVILFDPKEEEQRQEAERLNKFMVHAALSMEGTFFCSGQYNNFCLFLDTKWGYW